MTQNPSPTCHRDNMRKWVAALRSGLYQQGFGALAKKVNGEKRYCCLGVACEVAIADGLGLKHIENEWGSAYGVSRCISALPAEVLDWLGLGPEEGDCTIGTWESGTRISAISVNDGHNWGFGRIADAIEAHYGLNETDEVAQ